MTVTNLKNANGAPNEDVIDALEHALELARSGELRSVTITGYLIGHRTFTDFSTDDFQKNIGMLTFMLHTLCARQRENIE